MGRSICVISMLLLMLVSMPRAMAASPHSFSVAIEQDGQAIPIVGGSAKLDGKAFYLVITFKGPDRAVLVNASNRADFYNAARANVPLGKIVPFTRTGMAESAADYDLSVADAPHYWFFESDLENRCHVVLKQANELVCKRLVRRIRGYEADGEEAVYLVFVDAPSKTPAQVREERHRESVKLVFATRPKDLIPLSPEEWQRDRARIVREINEFRRKSPQSNDSLQRTSAERAMSIPGYRKKLQDRIAQSALRYAPAEMRGRATFALTLRADGTLEYVDVVRSSGDPGFDAKAFHLIRLAAPFPAVPPELSRDATFVTMPIEFGLLPQ